MKILPSGANQIGKLLSRSIPDYLICYHGSVSSLFSNDEMRQLITDELICSFGINYCFLLISSSSSSSPSSSSWFSALATLFEEYVREINKPGAVPIVQNAWDVFTEKKCRECLENAKAVYDAEMKELCLPCDDMKIRRFHETQLIEALSFFENFTEDIDLTARMKYIEELAKSIHEIFILRLQSWNLLLQNV
ncbi:PREDICTED: uncharacterized protein LOC107342813 [Acropora digitifera]|uniref:uncharacterized protein LOC107342813 n=1 Tax=Acropora digitifera TaxID=70779 RepID=UPI00077A4318|nr:PREDICTED: uncharacterized protein LOC107342813 [Acropora digitifera]